MKAVAVEVFERYKDVQKVSVASDGQAFIVDNGDAAAKNHAKNNAYGKELSVVTFLRDEVVQEKKQTPKADKKTAAELIAEIEKAETEEAVNTVLGKDKRATVLAAAEKRIAELKENTGSGDTEGADNTTGKDNVDTADSNPKTEE